MQFKAVEKEDEALLNTYLKKTPYGICDLFFPNLFMWMDVYQSKYAIVDDFLIIMEKDQHFLMPIGTGDLKQPIEKIMTYCKDKQQPFQLSGITAAMEETLMALYPTMFCIDMQRDYADYLYKSVDLIQLKGKKYQSKRNHINQFKKRYDYTFEVINEHNMNDVLAMNEQWFLAKQNDTLEARLEKSAIQRVIENYQALRVDGALLRVNGEVVAFSFGAPINDDVYNICIEKGNYDIVGVYAIINQCFATQFCQDFTYINREEDLGLTGLRKAKLSYHPSILETKGIVTLKEDPYVSS